MARCSGRCGPGSPLVRLLIDGTPLLVRSAGVKNYLHYWLEHLLRLAPPDEIEVFPFLSRCGPLDHERSQLSRAATMARLVAVQAINWGLTPLLEILAARADLVHLTSQVRRPVRRAPMTATLFDMTVFLMPELHSDANVRAERDFAERVLKRAAGLIAISQSTREDSIRVLGLDPRRIEVVYPGVAEVYFQARAEDAGPLRCRYGLAKPYVLMLGTIEPRKNVARLLDAWAQVRHSLREEFELVLAGPAGWAPSQLMARLISGEPAVRYIGYVPEPELPALTAGATACVYPSLYEGFGFPLVQAMAAGVPALTSQVSSLPEVAGGAALLVDPLSVASIRDGLEKLLLEEGLRRRLAEAGRKRARAFLWQECARRSLEFFRRVAGR